MLAEEAGEEIEEVAAPVLPGVAAVGGVVNVGVACGIEFLHVVIVQFFHEIVGAEGDIVKFRGRGELFLQLVVDIFVYGEIPRRIFGNCAVDFAVAYNWKVFLELFPDFSETAYRADAVVVERIGCLGGK